MFNDDFIIMLYFYFYGYFGVMMIGFVKFFFYSNNN